MRWRPGGAVRLMGRQCAMCLRPDRVAAGDDIAPAASLTTVESTASRYDLARASRKLPVLAIFVIRVTQSESHVTPYCAISYITSGQPLETFASVVLVDVVAITAIQLAAACPWHSPFLFLL